MKRLSTIITNPITIIVGLVVLLAITNYVPGTILSGGDNLHPEFNFWLNIKRSIFAVWQEYQGVGLLGGMGHAAGLPHQLILLVMSAIIPQTLLRFVFTMGTLAIGGIGAYYLARKLLTSFLSSVSFVSSFALVSGIFYILNLATIQTYFFAFETFTVHFASLPWLLLTIINYFQHANRKNFGFLLLTLILSLPQAYVPTLFLVFLMAVGILLPFLKSSLTIRQFSHKTIRLAIVIILVNAFWLFPFLLFTTQNAHINLNAKINQMATETIFLQNKEFGHLDDVVLLRGFWFNNVDPNVQGNFVYDMVFWRDFISNPAITFIGYLLFAIVVLGLVMAMKKRGPLLIGFGILFLFAFTMLATATPPFSWIDELFRKLPLISQAFRFPFTKFSILASLMYALFFSIGLHAISSYCSSLSRTTTSRLAQELLGLARIIPIVAVLILFVFVAPVFRGALFYEKEQIKLPQEYHDLFAFFDKQDPNTRIANFPQSTFWSWNYYRFGYSGSGFLWYGISQPILDRAFDPWSDKNENYYFEISNAIYSRNELLFASILEKYQITWLLIDKNVQSPFSPKAAFTEELEGIINHRQNISKAAEFGSITVYKVSLKNPPNHFVFMEKSVPSANGYKTGSHDLMYQKFGTYMNSSQPSFTYPFRSLFTGKTEKEKEFSMTETYDAIILSQKIPPHKEQYLHIPSMTQTEDIVPISIIVNNNDPKTTEIGILLQTPVVLIDDVKIAETTLYRPLFIIPKSSELLNLNLNGLINIPIKPSGTEKMKTSFLSLQQPNSLVLTGANMKPQSQIISPEAIIDTIGNTSEQIYILPKSDREQTITVKTVKITDDFQSISTSPFRNGAVRNCDNFRIGTAKTEYTNEGILFTATNASPCISFFGANTSHGEGYALFIKNRNIAGRSLHLWILNENEKIAPLDTYLPQNGKENFSSFIIAPMEPFGTGYSLHVDAIAIGDDTTKNVLGSLEMYPIPYRFITEIFLNPNTEVQPSMSITEDITGVSHPNESLYVIGLKPTNDSRTLMLSQAHDEGWKAYAIQKYESRIMNYATMILPFFFGEEIKQHVMVNNWENGWILPGNISEDSGIVIIYLPQYLQFAGFGLLGVSGILYLVFSILPHVRALKAAR